MVPGDNRTQRFWNLKILKPEVIGILKLLRPKDIGTWSYWNLKIF